MAALEDSAADAAREFNAGPKVLEAARRLLERHSLSALCQALATAQGDDADALIACLERLTEYEEVRARLLGPDMSQFMGQGATAPSERVRKLVARLLSRLAASDAGAARLAEGGLIGACEALLQDPETGTAEAAADAIRAAVKCPAGYEVVIGMGGTGDGLVDRLLAKLSSTPDTERMRVLQLFVDLGRASDEAFAALESRKAYDAVVNSFLTDDLLLKLNAVELMDSLGSFANGQHLLSREGIPRRLAAELEDAMNDSSIRLCVVRLLGYVVLRDEAAAETLLPQREAPLAQALAGFLVSKDPSERLCALHAWSNCCSSKYGLTFFLGWPPLLQDIVSLVSTTHNEVSKGAMVAWTSVLQRLPPPRAAPDPSAVDVQLWLLALQKLLPLALANIAGKPFADVREHTWRLLACLVRAPRAMGLIMPSEEIRNSLLDFTSETNYEARIAKHEFVVALVKHHESGLAAFLDADVQRLLAEFSRQHASWVPREAQATVGQGSA